VIKAFTRKKTPDVQLSRIHSGVLIDCNYWYLGRVVNYKKVPF